MADGVLLMSELARVYIGREAVIRRIDRKRFHFFSLTLDGKKRTHPILRVASCHHHFFGSKTLNLMRNVPMIRKRFITSDLPFLPAFALD